jgi:hypothetical protein
MRVLEAAECAVCGLCWHKEDKAVGKQQTAKNAEKNLVCCLWAAAAATHPPTQNATHIGRAP